MALNIKNERVIALAKQASELTGDSQTSAIELALRELIADREGAQGQGRADLVWQSLAVIDARLSAQQAASIDEALVDLYDEQGLPA